MTKQIEDYLEADNVSYRICSMRGEGELCLQSLGIASHGGSTACWRGWFATWCLLEGRLFVKRLTVMAEKAPPICNVYPENDHGYAIYSDLMLPVGYTGNIVVFPAADERRAELLHWGIPEKDEIVPQFQLDFSVGRLKSVANTSYLLPAGLDSNFPGEAASLGRIFSEVPTPFDSLLYQHFDPWD